MIAYFDSSSIVKWFFDEIFMDLARSVREKAEVAVTSLVSFPEVISAFHRAWKENRCSKADMMKVRKEFLRIWPDFQWVKPDASLAVQAGQFVFKYDLRGIDALHLASAVLLKKEGQSVEVFFSCFDRRLNLAAGKEGLAVHREVR